jgi:hypothetical protein
MCTFLNSERHLSWQNLSRQSGHYQICAFSPLNLFKHIVHSVCSLVLLKSLIWSMGLAESLQSRPLNVTSIPICSYLIVWILIFQNLGDSLISQPFIVKEYLSLNTLCSICANYALQKLFFYKPVIQLNHNSWEKLFQIVGRDKTKLLIKSVCVRFNWISINLRENLICPTIW